MTTLESVWLAVLGLLLAGYFVLGGYDYGVQMLHHRLGREESGRRAAISAMGPFFLGNEVWLVAFTGVLFGAFPHLEGSLLSGLYPLIVAILVGLVVGNTAVQLRGRARGERSRRVWDMLTVVGGGLPALCWGLVLGLLLHGVPRRADGTFHVGPAEVFAPFTLLCGVGAALLFAAHGAAFLALRSEGGLAERARAAALRLLGAFAVAGLLAVLLSVAGAGASVTNPVAAAAVTAVLALALAAAWRSLAAGRAGRAFAATCLAAALPVLLVGAGHYPYLLASSAGHGLTVSRSAADGATLKLLLAFGVVLIPLILLYQAWSWWMFRGRTGRRHPAYF
ncbi:cytochrome d ubiquinol oxidase subunit II [Streptomyces gamaensis]|uniref:Cytochrome d ubiquinol oxidase subunit II n=1 Tax=Streptomyces gamaensis TaxID=1763542 RepID=A0ABW0Z1W9_9ACTN